jgi:mannose/fructose/N-acetylgalactosamine-specific phosphotransferase system component IIC
VSWIPLTLLGAVVALDATSFGQLMLSRPLVAGTLAGALVGLPLEGALVGAMLEALSLGESCRWAQRSTRRQVRPRCSP